MTTEAKERSMRVRAIPPEVCLSIQNVGKAFRGPNGSSVALRDINLDIKRGEFVSLIGHSGCGKSTLLNLIAGMYEPSEGALILNGERIREPGPDRAVVFQQYSLLPWLSVRDNVFEAVDAVYKKKPKADKYALVDDFLRKVGLENARDKKPAQISGGMKQRVAIARAFATHPKVLLLDEPFGALDALTKGALHEELIRLWGGDSQIETVVMVTHDIDEAIYLSDRIVVMTNGPAATIGEIIDVPLPRPRDKQCMLRPQDWAGIKWGLVKERLLHLLTHSYAHPAAD